MYYLNEIKGIVLFILVIDTLAQNCPPIGRNITTAGDCTSVGLASGVCCMTSSIGFNPTNRTCVNILSYWGQTKYYDVVGNTWNLDCGNIAPTFKIGGTCGNDYIINAADCWRFSTDKNSCCHYLSNNKTGTAGCQWFKDKVGGEKLSETGMLLQCVSNMNQSSVIILFYVLIFSLLV